MEKDRFVMVNVFSLILNRVEYHFLEYEYYVKINKNGQIIESSLKEIEGAGEEYTVEKRMYKGCPKFHNSIPKKDEFLDK